MLPLIITRQKLDRAKNNSTYEAPKWVLGRSITCPTPLYMTSTVRYMQCDPGHVQVVTCEEVFCGSASYTSLTCPEMGLRNRRPHERQVQA